MNNFRAITSPTRARALTALATLGAGLLIAGCGGSSGGSSTLTIGNENTADNALIKSSASSSSTTSTTSTSASESTASVKTPTTGPLSKKPTAPVGHGSPPTKLITTDVIKGTGAEAKSGSSVVVNYVGVIWKTGKEFDSSWKRSETFPFTLGSGGVIKGWEEGVVGMKVGGRRILEIPAALAYGSKGTSGIPPNTPLTFVIDLLKA